MWILQIADIHLESAQYEVAHSRGIVQAMSNEVAALVEDSDTLIIAMCGDITYKGRPSNYEHALQFLGLIKESIPNAGITACPGNHDVCLHDRAHFDAFNRAAWQLTNNASVSFSDNQTIMTHTLADTAFVLANSAHHCDITYGCIDEDALRTALRETEDRQTVLVTHHNLIPTSIADISTTRNSYPILQLALKYKVSLILHGHVHMQTFLSIAGNSMCHIVGVGSLMFPPSRNVNNQFNLLHLTKQGMLEVHSFRLVEDKVAGSTHPHFVRDTHVVPIKGRLP